MTTATKKPAIERAEKKKQNAIELLDQAFQILNEAQNQITYVEGNGSSDAFQILNEAQNQITYVEGNGSSDAYDQIADAYQSVSKIRGGLKAMTATGMFEFE